MRWLDKPIRLLTCSLILPARMCRRPNVFLSKRGLSSAADKSARRSATRTHFSIVSGCIGLPPAVAMKSHCVGD